LYWFLGQLIIEKSEYSGQFIVVTSTVIFTFLNLFFLKLSQKNKLIEITTNSDFLDFADRVNYNKCRRKIRKAFKHVRVDFVHSKVDYWKVLDYSDKKITIME
jgi:hypothetical protein